MPRGRPKKPKPIYEVVIYQDVVTKCWHISNGTLWWTGIPTKELAIENCKENNWIIKEIRNGEE